MANFCSQCGTRLTDGVSCPNCGYTASPTNNVAEQPVNPTVAPASDAMQATAKVTQPEYEMEQPVSSRSQPEYEMGQPVSQTAQSANSTTSEPEYEMMMPMGDATSSDKTGGQNTTGSSSDSENDDIFSKATRTINELAGGKGAVKLNLKSLFSEVLKKHTNRESEEIFISGTETTTPPENAISSTWPKPWLFTRVFAILFLTYIGLYICWSYFQNINALPGMIFMGAIAVPFSLIIFFMETNAPRNISFFKILTIFLVGGAFSLVVTLLLFSFVSAADPYTEAIIVGIVEEAGKLIVIAFCVKKLKNINYTLNGLLIGAAVGAGFATFETAGYILRYGLNGGEALMMEVLILRAFLAPGGHVIWGAIMGGVLVSVKGKDEFNFSHLTHRKFITFYLICVAMHAIWDMPIQIEHYLVPIALTICAWVVALVLIDVGLKEISALDDQEVEIQQPEQQIVL